MIEIAWDHAGRFESTVSVDPGKFAEVCDKLAQGESIAWPFKGDRPVTFNIRYHTGNQVVFPAKQDAAVDAQGSLNVNSSQHYCWMWANKGTSPAKLQLTLKR